MGGRLDGTQSPSPASPVSSLVPLFPDTLAPLPESRQCGRAGILYAPPTCLGVFRCERCRKCCPLLGESDCRDRSGEGLAEVCVGGKWAAL